VVAATYLVGEVPVAKPIAAARPEALEVAPTPVFTPAAMRIPKIGMDAPIVPVGVEDDGTMSSPRNAVDIGWWSGRKAGQGNVLFDAHVNWNGRLGSFYRLHELVPGDEVVVMNDGKESLTYRVVWVKNFAAGIDATDLLGDGGGKQMVTLITCGGAFDTSIGHHIERVVARAELVVAEPLYVGREV
jgi:sortase (surface protein transpeptidase)